MKKIALVLWAVLVGAAPGWAAGPPQPPNLIVCTNDSGTVELAYAASSLSGAPRFSLWIDGEQLFPPAVPPRPPTPGLLRIQTDDTVFGTFVHALDATHTPLDEPMEVYGFFVPAVSVAPGARVEFPSVLLTGSVGGFLLPGVPAQRLEQAIPVTCEGSGVVF